MPQLQEVAERGLEAIACAGRTSKNPTLVSGYAAIWMAGVAGGSGLIWLPDAAGSDCVTTSGT